MKRPCLFCFVLLAAVQCLYGQDTTRAKARDTAQINKAYDLDHIVVTAQYEAGSASRSTYKVKVIDEGKIEALAAVNLKDALSNELNIRLSQDAVLGSSMSIQGLSGQNVKILVDGVPMIGRQNGNLDLSQINLNNVKRIEIVEGPMAVSYGTNALAGVINIITKQPAAEKLAARAIAYYETNNTYNIGISLDKRRGAHGVAANFNRNYFDGWNVDDPFRLFPAARPADTTRSKSWKPKEQYFGELQYAYEKKSTRLICRSAYFNELIINRGAPMKPYFETAFDDYYKTWRSDNSVSGQFKFRKYRSFNCVAAYNHYYRKKNTYYKDLTDLNEVLAQDASLQDTAVFTQAMARGSFTSSKPYLEYQDSLQRRNPFNVELGYDLSYATAQGKRIRKRRQGLGDYAVFASAEWRPSQNFVLRPGLRYAYNTAFAAPLIPSFNIRFSSGGWVLRASYAKGFRAPDLKELYFEFVDINHNISGNAGLRPERSDNYNLNVKYTFRRSAGELSPELSFFYNDINDLISLAIVSGTQYAYINVGSFKSHGSALNISYTCRGISFSGGASLTARYNDLSNEFSSVDRYSYTPEARGSVQYKIKRLNTAINCFYKYSGRLPGFALGAGEPVNTYINAFSMLDLNVSQPFLKSRLLVSAGAKNLLGVNNVNASLAGGVHSAGTGSTPVAMGRTYFIKLQYAFEK
jgi:outer membrane receptor for ferrienterochelin and colicins